MKLFYLIILYGLTLNVSFGQDTTVVYKKPTRDAPKKEFESFEDRLYYGGNVGASFGTTTFLNLSPLIGCKITKDFSMGIGAIYNYYSTSIYGQKYTTSIYGGSTFARYNVLENLFLQAGIDHINVPDYYNYTKLDSRIWIDNVLVGGGYKQSIGGNANMIAMIFYNLNQTQYSPNRNPIIQIGFNVGL